LARRHLDQLALFFSARDLESVLGLHKRKGLAHVSKPILVEELEDLSEY